MYFTSPRTRHVLPVLAALAALVLAANDARADRYSDAVAHDGRPAGDLKRDELDHPAEVLRLSGIRPGMVVGDFLAADGYYSELLSYIVGPKGHVYLLNNEAYDKWSENQWEGRLDGGRLPNVNHQTVVVENLGLPSRSLDAIILIKVYHDLYWQPHQGPWPTINPDAVLTEIARVVKPGGLLLLVDHSAKPGTGNADAGTLHRIDEQYARRDFEKHGFGFVSTSDVLRQKDDPRDLISYKGEMVGKTDRFVIVFRRLPPPRVPKGRHSASHSF
jgi:predicted methyltransferase